MRRRSIRNRGFFNPLAVRPRPQAANGRCTSGATRCRSYRTSLFTEQEFALVVPEPDIIGAEPLSDPYRYFARWREIEPVVLVPRHRTWLILDQSKCAVVLRNRRVSSNRINIHSSRQLADVGVAPIPMMSREQWR